jgi:hypothetical protein
MMQSRLISKHALKQIVRAWDVLEGVAWMVTLGAAFFNWKDSRIWRFQKVAVAFVNLAKLDRKALDPLIRPGVGFTGDGVVQRAREHSFVILGAAGLVVAALVLWYLRPGPGESNHPAESREQSPLKTAGSQAKAEMPRSAETRHVKQPAKNHPSVVLLQTHGKERPRLVWADEYAAGWDTDTGMADAGLLREEDDDDYEDGVRRQQEVDEAKGPSDKKNAGEKKKKKKQKPRVVAPHKNVGLNPIKLDKYNSVPMTEGKLQIGYCGRVELDGLDVLVTLKHVVEGNPKEVEGKVLKWKALTPGEDSVVIANPEGSNFRKLGKAAPVEEGRACCFVTDGTISYGTILTANKSGFTHSCHSVRGKSGAVMFMADDHNNWVPVGLNQGSIEVPGHPNLGVPLLFRS